MPSSSKAHRALMDRWFHSGADDGPPYAFLRARGWTETGGLLHPPVSSYNPSPYEVVCLLFLRDEWDYDFVHPLFPSIDIDTGELTHVSS